MIKTNKIGAALTGLILLVALVVSLSFWYFDQLETSAEARKHTFLVLNQADDFMSALKDAETGQRGYLLTGDETFLQQYVVVRDSARGQLKDLRLRSSIDSVKRHLDAMVPLVDAKLSEMEHVIALRKSGDTAAVQAVVGSGQGRLLMDSIRTEMRAVMQVEEAALAQHEAEFQSKLRRLFAVIVITSLMSLLFAVSFAYLLHRDSQQRLKNL